jgi:PKD repeat protein
VLNGSTGLISGKALEAGTYQVTLGASNEGGAGSASLALSVLPAAPVLNVGSLLAKAGVPFSYTISAASAPEQFGALGLPAWLQLDSKTGVLSGTPPAPGAAELVLSASNAGGTGTAAVALVVTALGPVFTQQPARKVTIPWGTSVTLGAQASGNPVPSYRWKRNGVVLPGETAPTLVLGYGAPSKNIYTVEAYNAGGSVESGPSEVETLAFTVGRPVLAVAGEGQPRGFILGKGFVLSASVEGVDAEAASPLWYRNGVPLKGGASARYTRGFAEAGDAGEYALAVTVGGVRVLGPALVLEQLTPRVVVNPPGLSVLEGGTARFTASLANGTLYAGEGVDFVWRSRGVEVARGAALTLPNVSAAAGGVYDVEVVHPVYGTGTGRAALQVSQLNILEQPAGGTVLAGQTVQLRVGAAAAEVEGLRYQWRRNGVAIAGATGAQYQFVQDGSVASANYDVEVGGVVAGKSVSVLSAPATVALLESVELDTALFARQARRLPLGQPLELSVRVSRGTAPYTFEWYRLNDGVATALADGVSGGTLVAGAKTPRLMLTPGEGRSAAGSYAVRVGNGGFAAVGGLVARSQAETAAVTVSYIQPPVGQRALTQSPAGAVEPGTNVQLGVEGMSEAEAAQLRFQWRRNGQFIAGATGSTYRVSVETREQTGVYDVVLANESGRATSAGAELAFKTAPAERVRALQDVAVLEGARLEWTGFEATGDALVYRWSRAGGVPGGGATGGALVIAAVSLADAGSYTVTAENSFGKVSSTATLRVLQRAEIALQPRLSGALIPGGKLTLEARARGGDPAVVGGDLQYQWLRNGSAIPGAVAPTLQLASVSAADDGARFALRVSVQDPVTRRVLHSVNSDSVTLSVLRSVEITGQPEGGSVDLNGKVRLAVTATGTGLEYQWRKDGVPVAGATGATLTLEAQENSGGVYDVVVRNAVNSVTSTGALLSVRVPVRIVTQPVGKTLNPLATVRLRVEAAGSTPLRYQWRRNGVALSDTARQSGTTSSELTVQQLEAGDLGDYDVVVANGIGAPQVSAVAVLGISEAASFTLQPAPVAVRVGEAARFAVKVSGLAGGKGQRLQWRRNGIPIPGAVGSVYTLPAARLTDAGDYDVLASSGAVQLTSDSAKLQVLEEVRLVRVPQAVTGALPESEAFPQATVELQATVVGGAAVKKWQWFKNGVLVSSFTGVGDTASCDVLAGDVPALYRVSVSSEVSVNGVVSSAGTVTSQEVPVRLLARVRLASQPQAATADAGGGATFNVAAEGGGVLAYAWERERAGRWSAIPGATGPVLSLTGLRVSDSGGYRVTVSNARGVETSAAAQLTVREPDVIVRQPLADASGSRRVNSGDTVVLEVEAAGTGLSYQWRRNGEALAGASALTSRLVLSGVTSADEGVYDVEVRHAYGTSASRLVRLLINVGPAITTQPADAALLGSTPATLLVRASGSKPLSYQWRRNGEAVAGGTGSSLSAGEAGLYDVVVENGAGRAVSRAAIVSAPEPVRIVQQPVSRAVVAGQRVEFKVVASGTPGVGRSTLSYRWRKDGVELVEKAGSLEGVHSETLVLFAVDPGASAVLGDGGAYDVVVSNDLNAVAAIPATLLIHTAPVFVKEPEHMALNLGDNALLSPAVRGTGPFTYTWYRRPLDSAGSAGAVRLPETSQNLVLEKFGTTAEPGYYWVVAANQYGETRSAEALVSQIQPLEILEEDALVPSAAPIAAAGTPPGANAAAARSVVATRGTRLPLAYTGVIRPQLGVSLQYQWRCNGVPLAEGSSLTGVQTQTLVLENVQDIHAGVYDLQITSYSGGVQRSQITTRTTVLKVLQPPVVKGLVDLLARPGQTVTFAPVVQSGGGSPKYRWFLNGQPLPDRTGATLTLLSVGAADVGEYEFEVADSNGITRAKVALSVASPLVVTPLPEVLSVRPRTQVQLEARVTAAAADGALRYQWRFNKVQIRGAVRSKLVLPAVLASQAGEYDVVVTNSRERVVSNVCVLRLVEPARILTEPRALSVLNPGLPLELSVTVGPQNGVTYQWIRGVGRGSVVLPGQTGATLRIPAATQQDEGVYMCVVNTPQGRLSSSLARVVVNDPS